MKKWILTFYVKKCIWLILISLCYITEIQGQEKSEQIPSITLIAESTGLTNVPFFYYSRATQEWQQKTGGFYHNDNENFEELKLLKYIANNTVYYCFSYKSSVPYMLDISTQLLQIENRTYRGAGAVSENQHSFYITNAQYQQLKLLLNGNENKSILLKSKLCDASLEWLLYKKKGRKLKRMKFERIGNKIRFLLPQSRSNKLVINFKKCYFEVDIEEFKNKILID